VLQAAFAGSATVRGGSCPGALPTIHGVIDWAGPTDVNDLLRGANRRGWATGWIGDAPDAEARARAASPLSHVRGGLPPVLIVHGDSDRTVPFAHSVRLCAALDTAGVACELVVLHGADHGPFRPGDAAVAWAAVLKFLGARAAEPVPSPRAPHYPSP
jgi:dipeptidyl aminopeptidase/acylaminoacyl peptidase